MKDKVDVQQLKITLDNNLIVYMELGQRAQLLMFTFIVNISTVGIVDNIDTGTVNTVHGVR